MNDQLCEILGYTPADLRGKMFPELIHSDDREPSLTAMHRLLEGEPPFLSRKLRLVRKDGAICWTSLCVSLVRDQDQYFIAVVEDITDKVQAELALREIERRLTLVQSVTRLGVWDRDLRTNIISTYGDYAWLHGLQPDHPPLTYEKWLAMVHPLDRERIQLHLRESVEQTHVWDREFRVLWPDGSVHWLLAKGTVYTDDAGRPVGMAGVSLDITERKEAEAALRESEERFRRVFEEGPLGVALVGRDYRFLKVNGALCRMVGYSESELTQMSFADITYPEDMVVNRGLAERMFRREIPSYWLQKRYVKKDGDIIWVSLTASVIRDAEGEPLYGLAMIVDITENKRAEAEALARQKLESLGVLAGGIAHDFNNLLGSILAEAELASANLAAGLSTGEELAENHDDCHPRRRNRSSAHDLLGPGQGKAGRAFGPIAARGRDDRVAQGLDIQTRGLEDRSLQGPARGPGQRATAETSPDEPDHQRIGSDRRAGRRDQYHYIERHRSGYQPQPMGRL